MKINNQKGFTLIELVLVITILGILAVAALPSFIDITSQATTASRDGVVGAIREGLAIQYSYDLVINPTSAAYPTTLGGTDGAASDNKLTDKASAAWAGKTADYALDEYKKRFQLATGRREVER